MELTRLGKSRLEVGKTTEKLGGLAPLDYAILVAVDETDSLEDIVKLCRTCRTYKGNKIRATASEIFQRVKTLKQSGLLA